jgi:hypothetical protein
MNDYEGIASGQQRLGYTYRVGDLLISQFAIHSFQQVTNMFERAPPEDVSRSRFYAAGEGHHSA